MDRFQWTVDTWSREYFHYVWTHIKHDVYQVGVKHGFGIDHYTMSAGKRAGICVVFFLEPNKSTVDLKGGMQQIAEIFKRKDVHHEFDDCLLAEYHRNSDRTGEFGMYDRIIDGEYGQYNPCHSYF